MVFKKCIICGKEGKIELHHPSYENKDMREYVLPLCRDCHRGIHSGRISCPKGIKLTEIKVSQGKTL